MDPAGYHLPPAKSHALATVGRAGDPARAPAVVEAKGASIEHRGREGAAARTADALRSVWVLDRTRHVAERLAGRRFVTATSRESAGGVRYLENSSTWTLTKCAC
jgi:hypothetical protein